ncbi:MAG: hypothetical protein DHS20C17_10290 [Cyclobacteriaceae bacterium]|nr:MAG: hypothetical protein DHS20C17_10290 [Cyclobacteriaceae bacterium]
MKTYVNNPVIVTAILLWIGFVGAISFMEAWLKFQAPGVNLAIGLGIGRLVFGVLNKIEWVFAVAILISAIAGKVKILSWENIFYLVPLFLLIIQTFWLLPELDARAERLIQNQQITPSNLHLYYVSGEIIKVVCLSVLGVRQFKNE